MTAVGPTRRVYLTGLSGAGKSAVAQATAARFGWTSVDTDALIVAQTGVAIAELFRTRGEAGFRRIERQVVRAATRAPHRVIALGGGAFLDPDTRALLLRTGLVVWLQVTPETAAARLAPDLAGDPRPLLGDDPVGRLRALLAARAPVYALAPLHVDTEGKTPGELAAAIVARLPAARTAAALP